jgi:LCP family protein required for cell wall assembly
MKTPRAGLGYTLEWLTLERAAIILPLLTVLGGCLLVASVLLEEGRPLPPLDVSQMAGTPWPTSMAGEGLPGEVVVVPVGHDGAPQPTPTSTPLPMAAEDMNVVLLGSDYRPDQDAMWRTDTIIIVAIRPRARLVALFSIPRDLWVTIPGYGQGRINIADCLGERLYGPGGGPQLLGATLQQNLGIPVHAYARVGFEGLERIVDALGGITVTVDRYFDEWLDPDHPYRWYLRLQPGRQRMNGRTALGYVRSRRNSSDLDRCWRQQQVLLAMRDAALRPAVVPLLPGLMPALADAVETDLTPGKVLAFARLARHLDASSYRTLVFDNTMVRNWITPAGAMVLVPDRARIERAWAGLTAAQP